MSEDNDVRKALLQFELVKETVKLFGPLTIDIISEAKPVVDAITGAWADSLGKAYRRLVEEYGCSDETARALLTTTYAELGRSISASLKK